MDKRTTDIVSYLTIIGFVVAYVAGEKEASKFHLNQGLVIGLGYLVSYIIGYIPLIGGLASWILSILLFVCMVIGLIGAAKGEEKEIPLLGALKLLK